LVFVANDPWQALACSVSLAFAMAGVAFSIQHDGNHGAYSETPLVNRLTGLALDVLGGSSYVWRFKHNVAHHTYTHLSGADGDIEVPLGRLCAGQVRKRHHRFQQIYIWVIYPFFVAYWHVFEDFQQVVRARVANNRFPRPRRWRLVELVVGKLVFFAWAFAIPMLLHPWWVVLGVYAFTSAVLSFVLILVFQLAHSVEEAALPHPDPTSKRVEKPWAVHQVEATANFAQENRVLSWYIGGLNFQIEHHLFPRVCHVHYPRIARIVEQTCAEFGVRYTVHGSCLEAVRSHFRWLRRMGQAA
jgi:linoleoyl-CoA desaturase